jgi:hypothetical protein
MPKLTHTFYAAVLVLAGTAQAEQLHPGRQTLDIKIYGLGHTQSGKASATVKTAETVHMAFTLVAGTPEPTNRLDLVANQQSMEKYMAASQAKAPPRDKQKEVMERGQKAIQACGQDVACMQRAALKLTQETSSWQAAPPPAPTEERYLTYAATMPNVCKPEYAARVNDVTEGTRNDVQGLVPFVQKASADDKGNANNLPILCAGMLVLDMKTNRIWFAGQVPAPHGRAVFTEGTHTVSDRPDAELALNHGALDWAIKQLNGGARSGKARTTLKQPLALAGGHKGDSAVTVDVSWSFQ